MLIVFITKSSELELLINFNLLFRKKRNQMDLVLKVNFIQ